MSNRLGLLIVIGALLAGPACQHSVGQVEDNQEEIACPTVTVAADSPLLQGLQDDVQLLGLINRLQLSAEQINRLLPLVEQLTQVRSAAQAEVAKVQEALVKALTEKRQLLLEDKPASQELERRLASLRFQLQQTQEQGVERLAAAARSLRPLFTEPQLEIVTGRYEARLQARELLDWLRGLSDSDFTEESAANAEGLADPGKGFDRETLVRLFASVRKMSAAEYEKQQGELAQKLAPLYSPGEDDENRQIAGAFAHPHMADLLREKLRILGNPAG
jgi:hypothetical protein